MFKKWKNKMAKKKNKEVEEQDVELQDQVAEQDQNVDIEEGGDLQDEDQSQIKELEAEKAELKDKQLRLLAEFENYKKRTVKEKIDMMSNAAKDTLSKLLPVLDDFDRAKRISDDEGSEEVFPDGVTMVYNKLHTTLKGLGLSEMETTGEVFDAEMHEAVTEIPAPNEEMKGKVVDTIEKGYLLNDKIIRHAKVVVGK
jgi:molecular chaperone GrpE